MEGAELPREPEATPHAASASAGLTLVIELEHCTAPRPTVSLKGTREAYCGTRRLSMLSCEVCCLWTRDW